MINKSTMYDLWKSLVSEFLGTLILVFVGAGAVALNVAQGGSVLNNALAFGLTYMFLIYTMSNYSGANFNPAISFGLALSGRLGWCRMILYWIVQFAGAIAGVALISWIFGLGNSHVGGNLNLANPWKVVLVEFFLSAFLIFVFLVVTKNPALSMASGFIIGLTLSALILFGGYVAEVLVNPAASLAIEIFNGNLQAFWIVVLGNFLGALAAVFFYKILAYPWTCQEIEQQGCNQECGLPPFYREFEDCTPEFMEKGLEMEAMGAQCFEPCRMPEPVCEPKCGRMGRRRPVAL